MKRIKQCDDLDFARLMLRAFLAFYNDNQRLEKTLESQIQGPLVLVFFKVVCQDITGLEPIPFAWLCNCSTIKNLTPKTYNQSGMCYKNSLISVEYEGFEPSVSCSQNMRITKLSQYSFQIHL